MTANAMTSRKAGRVIFMMGECIRKIVGVREYGDQGVAAGRSGRWAGIPKSFPNS
jgi:hypothetical protein